jgi:hypothetical protein
MKQRGKKTVGALTAVDMKEVVPRQPPPEVLTELETGIWLSVINTKPADWFQADTTQLMVAYCKHVSTAMLLDKQIAEFEPGWLSDDNGLDRYKQLTDMREKQTRAISALSRSMRLTQQSRYRASVAYVADRKETGRKKPWED